MASTSASRSPAGNCCVAVDEASTSAEVNVPETVPPVPGHGGVPAGPGFAAVPQSHTMIEPLTAFCAKWMCAIVTGACNPE